MKIPSPPFLNGEWGIPFAPRFGPCFRSWIAPRSHVSPPGPCRFFGPVCRGYLDMREPGYTVLSNRPLQLPALISSIISSTVSKQLSNSVNAFPT